MATRILGPTGSKRRLRFLLAPVLVAALAAVFLVSGAQAVHDTGFFQLDGDTSSATNTLGTPNAADDWDKVCHEATNNPACGTTQNTTGAIATAWTGDCSPPATGFGCTDNNATIFTGGGSKDPIDISGWAWKDGAGGLPDKDNLVHAFAVRYSEPSATNCPTGGFATCELLYFGSDRFSNSGDAQQGFWFLQDRVSLGTNKVGGASGFNGVHKTGDILVISDFSNGGTTSTISVFKWDPACTATNKPDGDCADANLRTLLTSANANCVTAQDADQACGVVNPADGTPTSWPTDYTDKTGNHSYLQGELFEAGINLSTLGVGGECFSSVVSETRSSTSTTATLKDFVLGGFGNCIPNLTTSVAGLPADNTRTVSPGTAVHDTATITVTGAATPDDAQGTVDFFLCGPNASANPDCTSGGADAGAGKTLVDTSNPPNTKDGISGASSDDVNTAANPLAPGFYCFRAEATLTNYDSPAAFTNDTSECFRVRDTSTTTTAQNWLPNDTAHVTSGSALSGTVDFSLYTGSTCDAANLVHTFANRPIDASGNASTDNGSSAANTFALAVTPGETISWKATFNSSDANIDGSTSGCESSVVTIND